MSPAARAAYACQSCGARLAKWTGQCPECEDWNCVIEVPANPGSARGGRTGGSAPARIQPASQVSAARESCLSTGMRELDRVLGGGLVAGAVVLIGGDPGIGKSTLLLQLLVGLIGRSDRPVLYVTGEESLHQVVLRAERLGLNLDGLDLLADTRVEHLLEALHAARPGTVVIDSIQTMHTDLLQSAPGSVSQVRESAARLVRFAKEHDAATFLVGHVTKEGALAGPRVLEHMVDTVLYFESETGHRHRVIRAVKNRFGAANELGIFAMTEAGLREVANPSAIFLSRHESAVPGSIVMVTREGTRPLLVELQALVDDGSPANPRRVAVGLESNRLAMLLAVLHRHAGIALQDQDVFVNAVGGVRVSETAADLPILAAIMSSFRDAPIDRALVAFGEVGLAGEIRPVPDGELRLSEAAKHGFTRALVPAANRIRKAPDGMTVVSVSRLSEALEQL